MAEAWGPQSSCAQQAWGHMLPHRKSLECQVEMFSCECFVGRSFQWSGLSLNSGCFVFLSWAQSPSVFYLFFVELKSVFVGSQVLFQRML